MPNVPSCSYTATAVGTQAVSKGRQGSHAANTVQASSHHTRCMPCRANMLSELLLQWTDNCLFRLATPC